MARDEPKGEGPGAGLSWEGSCVGAMFGFELDAETRVERIIVQKTLASRAGDETRREPSQVFACGGTRRFRRLLKEKKEKELCGAKPIILITSPSNEEAIRELFDTSGCDG